MSKLAPDEPPKRRGCADAVAPDIRLIAAPAFVRAGFSDPRLVLHWSEIAGAETARICLPIKLSGGVLTLKAEPGAAVFLQYETRPLCDRINAYLGKPLVSKLKFVQGALAPRPKPSPRRIPADTVNDDDPVQKYSGPDGLRAALVKLARARRSRTILG
jgi:hypothetical protein